MVLVLILVLGEDVLGATSTSSRDSFVERGEENRRTSKMIKQFCHALNRFQTNGSKVPKDSEAISRIGHGIIETNI